MACIYSTLINFLVSSCLTIFSFAWYRYALIRACCWTVWFVTYSTRRESLYFLCCLLHWLSAASMSGLFERSMYAEGACHQLLTQIHFYKIWRKIRNLDITETGRVHVIIHVYIREKGKLESCSRSYLCFLPFWIWHYTFVFQFRFKIRNYLISICHKCRAVTKVPFNIFFKISCKMYRANLLQIGCRSWIKIRLISQRENIYILRITFRCY